MKVCGGGKGRCGGEAERRGEAEQRGGEGGKRFKLDDARRAVDAVTTLKRKTRLEVRRLGPGAHLWRGPRPAVSKVAGSSCCRTSGRRFEALQIGHFVGADPRRQLGAIAPSSKDCPQPVPPQLGVTAPASRLALCPLRSDDEPWRCRAMSRDFRLRLCTCCGSRSPEYCVWVSLERERDRAGDGDDEARCRSLRLSRGCGNKVSLKLKGHRARGASIDR